MILIGATTENPSFEVNAALLSRSKVFVLKPLDEAAVVRILRRAMTDVERGLGREKPEATDDALGAIARYANGDARAALNLLQLAVATAPQPAGHAVIDLPLLERTLQKHALLYDKGGEEHYNIMSALHKSMRNSDPDAAIYWLARMLEAGEDPLYVARRLVRFASEDVGNADPQALTVAVAAKDAVHFIGMPEGNTALAQAALYLATAPKSNAVYLAYGAAADAAERDAAEPGPAASAQRADEADEAARLRQGLSLRARRARCGGGDGLPAGESARPEVLQTDRARLRERDQTAARRLGRNQEARAVSGRLRLTSALRSPTPFAPRDVNESIDSAAAQRGAIRANSSIQWRTTVTVSSAPTVLTRNRPSLETL